MKTKAILLSMLLVLFACALPVYTRELQQAVAAGVLPKLVKTSFRSSILNRLSQPCHGLQPARETLSYLN